MPCFNPTTAYRMDDGAISFGRVGELGGREVSLPCGRCAGCRKNLALMWSLRCQHEASLHDRNCFVTLTYDDDHVPWGLEKAKLQTFLKNLRNRIGRYRYFAVGEYGGQSFRPHYHLLLFGVWFPDAALSRPGSRPLWRSSVLESLWREGFSSIGMVDEGTARYTCGYVVKKLDGEKGPRKKLDLMTGEVIEVPREFALMSRRPGLGQGWLKKNWKEVFAEEKCEVVLTGGAKVAPPRYYHKMLEAWEPELADQVKVWKRERLTGEEIAERSRDRLEVKEKISQAQFVRNKERESI